MKKIEITIKTKTFSIMKLQKTTSGSEIYCYDIEDVEREDVIKVVKELIKMCKED